MQPIPVKHYHPRIVPILQEGPADLQQEARVLGAYLLGRPVDSPVIDLYQRAARLRPILVEPGDARTMEFVLRHPRWLGSIDGALALTNPRSAVRKKLLMMAAILETRPEHAHLFLPGGGSTVEAILAGFRGALRSALGLILLRLI